MATAVLDIARIQHLARTAGYPRISAEQARRAVAIIAGAHDPADHDSDPLWDLAWAVSSHLVAQLTPHLSDDMMEIGWIAERILPICREVIAAGEVA